MEQTPKTSFIPKQSMNAVPSTVRRRRSFNVLGLIATILFLGSLILSIGVFLYERYSESKLTALKSQLAESRSSFRQGDIESIRELEQRLVSVETLLDGHLMTSDIFDVLERRTQRDLQLTSFLFERRSSGNASLDVGGKASRFNTIALQGTQFANEPAFESSLFSGINIVIEGEDEAATESVVFGMHAELNEDIIRYAVSRPSETPLPEPVPAEVPETVDDGATTTDIGEDL